MDQEDHSETQLPPSSPKTHRDVPELSLRSDASMGRWMDIKGDHGPQDVPELSLRSDASMGRWMDIKGDHGPQYVPELSGVSLRSDASMGRWMDIKGEHGPQMELQDPEVYIGQQQQTQLDSIFKLLEEDIFTFVQRELKRIHKILSTDYLECFDQLKDEDEEQRSSSEAFLKITVNFLRRRQQKELAERLWSRSCCGVLQRKLKSDLQQKFQCVFEGIAKPGNPTLLKQIYTELHITEGGASEINLEHEVRQMETSSRKVGQLESAITCEDMFKGPADTEVPIRTVLTKGVAGIGKTVLTQNFSLDWAEGKANQDIQLLFPFTFRALNVLKDRSLSLVQLVHHFFSETEAEFCSFEDLQVLFIFDGLDECRLPLDFTKTNVLTDPTECASVGELLVNLIRGSLLPFARLWITSRPAAASQIPAECVSLVTEVRGFTDPQKEQYFIKKFRDEAPTIISHIKASRSIHIMCTMPIFCWMLSTVLKHVLKTRVRQELPHTLTQMYIHFLVVQAKVKNIKYEGGSETDPHWSPVTREMVQSLGKLAFEQLQKGNLIFYDSDLNECGLDAAAASVYSGVFTQIFREEPGLYQDKVYCFIHLSVQEFLAALHVHQTFFSSGENLLSTQQTSEGLGTTKTSRFKDLQKKIPFKKKRNPKQMTHSSECVNSQSPEVFYRSAVDQALQSPNGQLDLFLRFLLGLSLPTNQSLLPGLLTQAGGDSTNQETVKYIKQKLNEEGLSAERSLNLLHCLNELNDRSLMEEIQNIMRERGFSWLSSPAQWSALSFFLLSSDSDLEEFDLKKYWASETALLNLLPVVKASTKAILSCCNLSQSVCDPLASVLSSSSLTHLDLSNNDLQDSGVELLCEGLKSTHCRLHTLRLSGCLVSERGGATLASALSSTSSHLRELDLSYNHPGPSAKLLTALLAPHGLLDSLRLDPAGEQWMVPGLRKYTCEFSLDPNTVQKNLCLFEDKRTVTVSEEQQYPHHEDRFMDEPQVLSSTGLMGRCYWEVQWTWGWIDIAVSHRGMRRRGDREESRFGNNDQSWRLNIREGNYSACHNKRETEPCHFSHYNYHSGEVGVFLDSEAGTLSFYDRSSGKLSHIYTFFSSFTEPLFPGFGLRDDGNAVTVVDLSRVPPDRPL